MSPSGFWGLQTFSASFQLSLEPRTTLFDEIEVILAHFKWHWNFSKTDQSWPVLLENAHFQQNKQKKAIFSKIFEISIFSKKFIIHPKCMKSKYDGPEVMKNTFAVPEDS